MVWNAKTILSFLKNWVYKRYVGHTQNPKSDKCYFVKVISNMFDIPLSLHQSKTVCCLERCVLKKNGFLQKSEWEDSATCQDC